MVQIVILSDVLIFNMEILGHACKLNTLSLDCSNVTRQVGYQDQQPSRFTGSRQSIQRYIQVPKLFPYYDR